MFSRLHHRFGIRLPVGTALHKEDIKELHYILPISSLASVMRDGILSHKRVKDRGLDHVDISNPEVQARREISILRANPKKKRLTIHRHANFYLNAHNAMMFVDVWKKIEHKQYQLQSGDRERYKHEELCVLRICREILERGDAILSSRNAARKAATFFLPTRDPLYSPRSTDYLTVDCVPGYEVEGKPIRMAEVLLPYQVDPSYIGGIFVSCEGSHDMVQGILLSIEKPLPITVHPSLFFQRKIESRNPFVPLEPFIPLSPLTAEQRSQLHEGLPDSSPESSDTEMALAGDAAGPAPK